MVGLTTRRNRGLGLLGTLLATVLLASFVPTASAQKVLQLPIRSDGPKSLDPVEGTTVYDNMACAQIYETLLVNKYADPTQYEPLLLESLPEANESRTVYTFTLKDGVRFQDNPCFAGGKGREITPEDVFYSLKRLGDLKYQQKNLWLIENTIKGFDDYVAEQVAAVEAGGTYDYDAPVEGFRKIDDRTFEIELVEPVTRFLWVLTMFQTSVVPREAVEAADGSLAFAPVGTGPFMLVSKDDWKPKTSLHLVKNPNYHEVLYPERDEWSRDDRRLRLHRPAGERVPFADRIEFTMFAQDQPMWLQFSSGNIGYTQVPDEYFGQAFDRRTKELLPEQSEKGVRGHSNKLLDFIFRAFNMEDPILGAPAGERGKKLRQAMSLATDLEEFNQAFYSGTVFVYDGPIPPTLDGHPEDGRVEGSYRGLDLVRARQLMVEAGYPNGEGLPTFPYYANRGSNSPEQTELFQRQLARIGIKLEPRLVDFSDLIAAVDRKIAPMFSFAWSSDYPDGENNLALFYGPNESPGANHFNYKDAAYDEMYEQILRMPIGEERTALMIKMRDQIIEDVPYIGSMARERFYVINPWLLNCKPTERYYSWFKYLDVDDSARPGS